MKQAVILAAGESSRFWPLNYQHKSLIKIMGYPLIFYTIEGLRKQGVREVFIIQNPKKDIEKQLEKYKFPNLKIRYVIQKEPKGMGNAIMSTKNLITGPFFVLHGHKVQAGNYLNLMSKKFDSRKDCPIFLGNKTNQPWFYGILKFKGNKITGLVEKPKKGKAPSNIRVAGIYLLPKKFFEYHQKVPKEQYSFEKSLDLFIKARGAEVVITEKESTSYKYPWHLFQINKELMDTNLKSHIEKSVNIAKNVTIDGKVYIGKGVKIFENAVIKGPCYIGSNCVIGNNSLIREYTNLENDTLIGAFAEITRSIFQENTHCHSGFIGDSILGKDCRLGAGAITANIRLDREEINSFIKNKKINTGLKSLGVITGKNTKVGIHCSFMPGILIGSDCQIGPHSAVFKNIEDNKKFFTRLESIKK